MMLRMMVHVWLVRQLVNDDESVEHDWNDPEIDTIIEEMVGSYDDQPY